MYVTGRQVINEHAALFALLTHHLILVALNLPTGSGQNELPTNTECIAIHDVITHMTKHHPDLDLDLASIFSCFISKHK